MESSFKNMVLVLTGITCLSGAILGGVNMITTAPIQEAKLAKQLNAIKMVAPAYDNDPLAEKQVITLADGTQATIYPAKMGGQEVGAAVEAITKKGFSGTINVMVGFKKDGSINEYTVLSHAETPGLGSKMQEWFHTKSSVLGLTPGTSAFKLSKEGGKVDAITAATISSRAFLDAVTNAYNAYKDQADASSGATPPSKFEHLYNEKEEKQS